MTLSSHYTSLVTLAKQRHASLKASREQECSRLALSWEKRNVLIVSVLLPIAIDLALRSKTQRRI